MSVIMHERTFKGAVNASGEAVGPLRKAARAGIDKATLKPGIVFLKNSHTILGCCVPNFCLFVLLSIAPLLPLAHAPSPLFSLVLLDPSAVLLAAPESDAFDVRGEQLQNAELVRRAFADGADTQAAFLKEKQAVVEEVI